MYLLTADLDPYEHMEADCGYRSHVDKIKKCPENIGNPAENLAMCLKIEF